MTNAAAFERNRPLAWVNVPPTYSRPALSASALTSPFVRAGNVSRAPARENAASRSRLLPATVVKPPPANTVELVATTALTSPPTAGWKVEITFPEPSNAARFETVTEFPEWSLTLVNVPPM